VVTFELIDAPMFGHNHTELHVWVSGKNVSRADLEISSPRVGEQCAQAAVQRIVGLSERGNA
jgi:hypothetical protein